MGRPTAHTIKRQFSGAAYAHKSDHLPMCQIFPLDCMGDISRFGKMSHALTYDSSRGKVLRLRQYQTNTAAKHKQKARESQKRESSSRQLPL